MFAIRAEDVVDRVQAIVHGSSSECTRSGTGQGSRRSYGGLSRRHDGTSWQPQGPGRRYGPTTILLESINQFCNGRNVTTHFLSGYVLDGQIDKAIATALLGGSCPAIAKDEYALINL